MGKANCENCLNYAYDEELDEYACGISLDEDEYAGILYGTGTECPYFRFGDEYTIVRKQN